jgi:hypothetical protein
VCQWERLPALRNAWKKVAERAPSPSTNDRRALKSPQTESFLVWARDVFFTIELVPATLIGLRRRRFLFIRMTDPRRYCQTRLRHDTPREHSLRPYNPRGSFNTNSWKKFWQHRQFDSTAQDGGQRLQINSIQCFNSTYIVIRVPQNVLWSECNMLFFLFRLH